MLQQNKQNHSSRAQTTWSLNDIDFSKINHDAIIDHKDLLLVIGAASFIESASFLYANNLADFFHTDSEIVDWLKTYWEHEELQHGHALKKYIQHIWPDFDWDATFTRFLAEYTQYCGPEDLEENYTLEMVTRCVIETGTSTLYHALNALVKEPVLKQIVGNIRADEIRHYKYFLKYFKKYQPVEKVGRRAVTKTLLVRLQEIRKSDSEIAMRHVYQARYPEKAQDTRDFQNTCNNIYAAVRAHAPLDTAVKMLLKPLNLPKYFEMCVHYVIKKGANYTISFVNAREKR